MENHVNIGQYAKVEVGSTMSKHIRNRTQNGGQSTAGYEFDVVRSNQGYEDKLSRRTHGYTNIGNTILTNRLRKYLLCAEVSL